MCYMSQNIHLFLLSYSSVLNIRFNRSCKRGARLPHTCTKDCSALASRPPHRTAGYAEHGHRVIEASINDGNTVTGRERCRDGDRQLVGETSGASFCEVSVYT